MVKYCLVPSSETQKNLYNETVDKEKHPDHILSDWLTDFHANNDAEYLFQVQFCENLTDQPVEYAGKVWDSEKYPWQTVGKIVIPKQDSMIPARKTFWEGMHILFSPNDAMNFSSVIFDDIFTMLSRVKVANTSPLDHIILNPWHGLKSFQPLGSPNRLRRVVYPASSSFRRKLNGRREIHVRTIDEIPDGGYVS